MNKLSMSILNFMLMLAVMLAVMLISGCNGSGGSGDAAQADLPNSPSPSATVDDGAAIEPASLASLGEKLFNDTNLSSPAGQSCASCHSPSVGFDDPDSGDATSLGADGFSIGNRNAPTASYAAHIPNSQIVIRPRPGGGTIPVLIGGQFLDGRADSLEEQAKGPFLNPAEMANNSKVDVIATIRQATYADDFDALFGAGVLDDVEAAYDHVADAIAAFERSAQFSPFTSKFDRVANNNAVFTQAEARGQNLFNGKAMCNRCHNTPGGGEQVFSDFEFRNIGVPTNPGLIAALGPFVDNGLGEITADVRDNGKFRTPNLRNIAITAPYMHNGVFSSLAEVVNFYNSRDSGFPDRPEVNANIANFGNIGELNLSGAEIADLLAFLETLTD